MDVVKTSAFLGAPHNILDRSLTFKCGSCECEFTATKGEYKQSAVMDEESNSVLVWCDCPVCGTRQSMYVKNIEAYME